MKNQPLISIIVPIYNAQDTLSRTLTSLRDQTWSNTQIVCVDDGSTDRSAEVLARFSSELENLLVVHTANQGVYRARETGVTYADGAFIGFCDAGDTMSPNFCQRMMAMAIHTGADIIVSGYQRIKGKDTISTEMVDHAAGSVPISPQSGWLVSVNTAVWNKLFRAETLEHRAKLDHAPRVMEDALFLLSLFPHASSMAFLPEPLYQYRIEDGSAMSHIDKREIAGLFDAWNNLRNNKQQIPESFLSIFDLAAFVHLGVSLPLRLMSLPGCDFKNELTTIEDSLKKQFPLYRSSPFISREYVKCHPAMKMTRIAYLCEQIHVLGLALRIYGWLIDRFKRDIKW